MRNKRLLILFLAILLCGCAIPPTARAQFIGFTSPQTVQANLATQVACSGPSQDFVVPNLGQTEHSFTILPGGGIISINAAVFGVDTAGDVTQISDNGFVIVSNSTVAAGTLVGVGYYPKVFIRIGCIPGTPPNLFSISYSGVTATPLLNAGSQLHSQTYKALLTAAPAAISATQILQTPFANSSSVITAEYTGVAGPAGSTITVSCPDTNNTAVIAGSPYTLDTTLGLVQSFFIPPLPCNTEEVDYVGGGASTALLQLTQQFFTPGTLISTLGMSTHITATTATAVKNGGGILTNVNVNTAAAGTVSVFDLASSACTGTPSTNVVAVITVNATDPSYTKTFNTGFRRGICVKASVGMDLTIGYQ